MVPFYVDANSSTLSLTTVTGPLTLWGQPMQFAYQATDLSLYITSSSSSSLPTQSSTAQPSATATPLSTTSNPSSSTSTSLPVSEGAGGLSRGATAGIAVGSTIAAISIVALAILLFWKKRARRRLSSRTNGHSPPMMQDTSQQPISRGF